MNDNRLSLTEVFTLRNKAIEKIREHSAAIDRLAAATGDLDVAMQTAIAVHRVDEMQTLVTSARLLSGAMDGRPA